MVFKISSKVGSKHKNEMNGKTELILLSLWFLKRMQFFCLCNINGRRTEPLPLASADTAVVAQNSHQLCRRGPEALIIMEHIITIGYKPNKTEHLYDFD